MIGLLLDASKHVKITISCGVLVKFQARADVCSVFIGSLDVSKDVRISLKNLLDICY
jgi:hypothetical protein